MPEGKEEPTHEPQTALGRYSRYDITPSSTTQCTEESTTRLPTARAAMPSLLLVVFTLQLLLHIINTVGANTINELVRLDPHPSTALLLLHYAVSANNH